MRAVGHTTDEVSVYHCGHPGELNVWADLLSSLWSGSGRVCPVRKVPFLVLPLRDKLFVWPTFMVLADAQRLHLDATTGVPLAELPHPDHLVNLPDDGLRLRLVGKVIWIPSVVSDLQPSLVVCAHVSLARH